MRKDKNIWLIRLKLKQSTARRRIFFGSYIFEIPKLNITINKLMYYMKNIKHAIFGCCNIRGKKEIGQGILFYRHRLCKDYVWSQGYN